MTKQIPFMLRFSKHSESFFSNPRECDVSEIHLKKSKPWIGGQIRSTKPVLSDVEGFEAQNNIR
jgi:hypothetical protein